MSIKYRMYLVLSIIALAAISAGSYFMLHTLLATNGSLATHKAAFACFLISALCIEGRVRMGYRLSRGTLFWTHLSAAIPFFTLLGVLAFIPLAPWLSVLCFVVFLATLGTGAVLFSRSYEASRPSGSQSLPQ